MNLFDNMSWSDDLRIIFLWTASLSGVGIVMHIFSAYLRETAQYVSFSYFFYEGLFSPSITEWVGAGPTIAFLVYYAIVFVLIAILIILSSRLKILFYLTIIVYTLLIIPFFDLSKIYI